MQHRATANYLLRTIACVLKGPRAWHRQLLALIRCAWLGSILLSGSAAAVQALPVAVVPTIASDSALALEMTALLRDYSEKLTLQRVLSWSDNMLNTRYWTPHLGAFRQACSQQKDACLLMLQAQLKALTARLGHVADGRRTPDTGVLLSALSDLCSVAPLLGTTDEQVFGYCGGQLGVAGSAAATWAELGYDELFRAYYADHEQTRRHLIAWLADQPASDHRAKTQRERLEANVSFALAATFATTNDDLPAASGAWLAYLISGMKTENDGMMLFAALSLARISYALDDVEQGDNWQRASQSLIAKRPGLMDMTGGSGCRFLTLEKRAELARAQATRSSQVLRDGAVMIRRLIEQDCGFTEISTEFALAGLRLGQPESVKTILAFAINTCVQSGDCAASRLRHLESLLRVATASRDALLKQSAYWLSESQAGTFDGVERNIVWALADALAGLADGRAAASQLYTALDNQIHSARVQLTGVYASSLKNLARYDQLSRVRVKIAVEQGGVLEFGDTESMRAQSLLRRLRLKRWELEFSGVRDDAARVQLATQLANQDQIRHAIASLSDHESVLLRPLRAALLMEIDEADTMARETALQELASREMEAAGGARRAAWLGSGANDLFWHEQKKNWTGVRATSLGADEAYLSWLRVPGGYVGTLASPDPQHTTGAASHHFVSRYVPLSGSMASTLELYRQLLQSGAGAVRGGKLLAAPQPDGPGLTLQGVPVWRLTDGAFVAAAQSPTGAVRAKSLDEVSEVISMLVLGAFQSEFKNTRRLMISPDGELAYLPFETLSIGGTSILDTLDIGYIQSLAVHEELTARALGRKRGAPTMLTLADPDYTPGAAETEASVPKALAAIKWRSLPGTRAESQEMRRLFPQAQQRLGALASRKELAALQEQNELSTYRILHFATHGYVDDQRSALVLSMTNGVAQGYLQDADVLALHLNSDLVLLSACDTGIGRSVSGEGVMGLPYAFLLAGNSNTLMSLWPVDDNGTAVFMATFMEKVRSGTDLLAALSQTKREFARAVHGKAFADPRIWAAFVQYGVGLSLQN